MDNNVKNLIFSNDVSGNIDAIAKELSPTGIYVIADVNTATFVVDRLAKTSTAIAGAHRITVKSGDINKTIESVTDIWKELNRQGATRNSLVINIGGGMVTDMGGFAAATFKRGLRFVNIPTTLLAAVDASVGGKTGINFNQYKNEVGLFCNAHAVIISTCFFDTLPREEILSGFAEMIKHAIIDANVGLGDLLRSDISAGTYTGNNFLEHVRRSVMVKQDIVSKDFKETGLRRILNLGHTVGHAFESHALRHGIPIAHGYAVAWGLVTELLISHMTLGLPTDIIYPLAKFIYENYGAYEISCDDYPSLLQLMGHDKKNESPDAITFSLLRDIGVIETGITVDPDTIRAALDIYRDLMHI